MTSLEDNNDSRYLLGRIEAKLDQLFEKLGHLAELVGRHDERLNSVEDKVKELERSKDIEQGQQVSHWGTLRAGLLSAVVSGLIGGVFILVQVLVK